MSSSLRAIDIARRDASKELDPHERSRLGQFMTPTAIADFMASLFTRWPDHVRLLDPGAGIGSLTEAFAEKFFTAAPSGATLEVSAFEVSRPLLRYLTEHLDALTQKAGAAGYRFIKGVVRFLIVTLTRFGGSGHAAPPPKPSPFQGEGEGGGQACGR